MRSVFAVTRQQVAPLAALALVFVAALDLTVVATLLPAIIVDLGVALTELDRAAWIVTAYLIAYTVAIPLLGRLSDHVGRLPVFLAAVLLFAAGSLWCARSNGLVDLIVGRVIQAIGGGATVPVTMALVADRLPAGRRATALGFVAAVDTAGWVAGPLYGAALVAALGDWRWVFWVNLPLAGLALLLLLLADAWPTWADAVALRHWRRSLRSLPWPGRLWPWPGRGDLWPMVGRRGQDWQTRVRGLDWPGASLLTLALLALNLGLSLGAEPFSAGGSLSSALATPSPLAAYRWPLLAVGLLALAGLVIVERSAAAALVPLALWRDRAFAAASLVNLLIGAAIIVAMVNVPVLVNTLTLDLAAAQWQSALLLTPLTGGMACGAWLGGWLSSRWATRWVVIGGLLMAAAAYWQMAHWPPRLELIGMSWPLGGLGLGIGLVIAPAASVALDASRGEDYGIASALVLVLRLTGMALGLSILTSWALSQLTTRLAAMPLPAPRPNEASGDFTARLAAELSARAVAIGSQVITETFWWAGLTCLVALLPAWWVMRHHRW